MPFWGDMLVPWRLYMVPCPVLPTPPPPPMVWVQNLRFGYIFMEPAKTHGIYNVLTSSASETVVFAAFCNTTLYTTTLIIVLLLLLLLLLQLLLLLLLLLASETSRAPHHSSTSTGGEGDHDPSTGGVGGGGATLHHIYPKKTQGLCATRRIFPRDLQQDPLNGPLKKPEYLIAPITSLGICW